MSISQFPRIYFKGGMSWDPGLGNNDIAYIDNSGNVIAPATYDPVNVSLRIPFNRTLQEHKDLYPQESGWNHFGTHHTNFEDVTVTGVSLNPGNIDTRDSLVGNPLLLKGKLVDAFPDIDHGTQLFFDNVQVGTAFTPGLMALRHKRLLMRYLNFERNRLNRFMGEPRFGPATNASAVWEVAFRKSGITMSNTASSPVLQELERSFQDGRVLGLLMRYHTYGTFYYRNGINNEIPEMPRTRDELRAYYANGKNFSNPAYSVVLGLICPWIEGDPDGHPAGRLIFPSAEIPNLPPSPEPPARMAWGHLGTTFIEVSRANERLTIDLGETVPEIDDALTKANVGDIQVVVEHQGVIRVIASVAPALYARESYERTSGLVDVEVTGLSEEDWAAVEGGRLYLQIGDTRVSEEPLYTVIAEDREIYLDEGESLNLHLKVTVRGDPAPAGVPVVVARYPGGREFDNVVATLTTEQNGRLVFSVAAQAPGMNTFVLYPYDPAGVAPVPDQDFQRSRHFYVDVRTLPFDDQLAATTPDSELTWQWVYENILAVYDVVNPVMSRQSNPRIARPLHDRQTMENYVSDIRRLIDKSNFENANYMPVTRELSKGKRSLLVRWCDLVERGAAPQLVASEKAAITRSSDPRV